MNGWGKKAQDVGCADSSLVELKRQANVIGLARSSDAETPRLPITTSRRVHLADAPHSILPKPGDANTCTTDHQRP